MVLYLKKNELTVRKTLSAVGTDEKFLLIYSFSSNEVFPPLFDIALRSVHYITFTLFFVFMLKYVLMFTVSMYFVNASSTALKTWK